MTDRTPSILASIDATLEGWHTWDPDVSDDAMRWSPEEPDVAPDGWAEAAHTFAGESPLVAYLRQLDARLANPVEPGSTFAAELEAVRCWSRDVFAPAMTEIGRQIATTVKPQIEALARAMANLRVPELVTPERATDPRQRALEAVRSRGTGPAAPRLDGRRRPPNA